MKLFKFTCICPPEKLNVLIILSSEPVSDGKGGEQPQGIFCST